MQQDQSSMRTITRTVIPLILAGAALALALTGLPSRVEAHGGDPTAFHGCKKNENGQLRLVGFSDTCRPSETAIDWSITGPQGPPGPIGPAGATGATGPAGPQGPAGDVFAFICPPDSVRSGMTCIDKYEASVWQTTDSTLISKIKDGTVTLADLNAAGATQISPSPSNFSCPTAFPGSFPATGNWNAPLYAVSIPGVPPTACVTWFQAEQACALSGKRLLTNQEWQRAAAGTPDTGGADNGTTTCNTDNLGFRGPSTTGARSACVSNFGAFDMVGNVEERVADWTPLSTACVTGLFGTGDYNCLAGASTTSGPGALLRGGHRSDVTFAGVFAVYGNYAPSIADGNIGFRCAR